ncbi:MAG TPA: M20/M25/M40 family metallo-hydrolase [Solirubrobacteraceae bacterium]|nr:M20/M25/M40 family metallo-hydrolase [Solirubrobacteraceae bacterium]
MSDDLDALIHEVADWLRIPSVSAGDRNEAALAEAARWAQRRVLDAGGTCELADTPGGAPLVVGELRAAREDAPTVLVYGHYDVQDPGDESLWTTPPFEPDIRDGRLYARGACDDKGNFLPLLHVACAMAEAGELDVHVRVLVEGAEESGTDDVNQWILADERGADCAIVFDAAMLDPHTPAVTVALRGIVFATLEVRTGERIAHSGLFGGAALNAFHALHAALARVLPGPDGRLPEDLRVGVEPPTPEELASWDSLPDGATVLAEAGARPADARAAAEFYTRTTADASLDVHRIAGGDARTIVPPTASCDLSVRLAPGQDPPEIAAALEALLRDGRPEGAELELTTVLAAPSSFDPGTEALRLARGALARACGRDAVLIRSGGSIPALAAFAERGIPTLVSGFALPQDNFHAPDESYAISSLDLGRRSARALYEDLSRLRPARP